MEQLTLFKDMEESKNKKELIINDEGKQCCLCEEFKLYEGFILIREATVMSLNVKSVVDQSRTNVI